MKLLFVVPYTPTPIRTRPYNLVRGLARRGHSVILATLWQNEEERAALDQLSKEGIGLVCARLGKARSAWNSLGALPTRTPLQAFYCWEPHLANDLKTEIRKHSFDAVHVEHLRGARYGLELLSAMHSMPSALRVPVVWDSVDCISYLFEQAANKSSSLKGRLMARFELPRTRRHESYLVSQFTRVLATSPLDAAELDKLVRQQRNAKSCSPVTVVPNGVDLEYFTPGQMAREPDTVIFSGKMSYHANVTTATYLITQIMPRVWQARPGVRVQIVGKDPPDQLADLKSRYSKFPIEITGTVPDIRPYLWRSSVAAIPLVYGAGSQFKVLEAMATQTPVVTTPRATAPLGVTHGDQVLLAEDADAFAREVLRLLDDAELRRRIGEAGRRYVERCHDWSEIVAHLEDIYLQLVENPTKAPHMAAAVSAPSTHS